jgi:hypothetical protein
MNVRLAGLRADLGTVEEKKEMSCFCRETNLDSSVVHLESNHSVEETNPALCKKKKNFRY